MMKVAVALAGTVENRKTSVNAQHSPSHITPTVDHTYAQLWLRIALLAIPILCDLSSKF